MSAIFVSAHAFGQDLPTLHPKINKIDFEESNRIFESAKKKQESGASLTRKEASIYDETKESFWDVNGAACSWYCGGGPKEVKASSSLPPSKDITYGGENAHDNSYKTAWVEGVKGDGIGEYLTYTFDGNSPRVTDIIVVNGYVKSKNAWKNNSRVKTLKMYIDGKPYALLELKDIIGTQRFHFQPIGNAPSNELGTDVPDRTLKFEIVDVYKGEKYDDTAISEIYFDGIDVHCFVKGSKVLMADYKEKNIEELKVGDKVITSANGSRTATIKGLAKQPHDNIVTYKFDNGTVLSCTPDHPILSTKGWVSLQPNKTTSYEGYEHVDTLAVGDTIVSINGKTKLISIANKGGSNKEDTYTITDLEWPVMGIDTEKNNKEEENYSFVVNGIIVGVEKLRK